MSRESENRVNGLKDLQLEEIMVGKLKGYNFECLLLSKEMGVVDKLFWTHKELSKLLSEKGKLAMRHRNLLYLFSANERKNSSLY